MGRKLVIDDAVFTRPGLESLNWTPVQLNPDLMLWLRASDAGNLLVDGANRVTSFADSRGALPGQIVMTPLVPANKMLRVAAEQNGKPGIKQDDGTARILTAGHQEPFNFEWTDPFSFAACFKHRGSYGNLLGQGNAGSGVFLTGWAVGFSSTPTLFLMNYSGSYYLLGAAQTMSIAENQTVVLQVTYDGSGTAAGIKFYKNGVLYPTTELGSSGTLGGRSIKSTSLGQLTLNGDQTGGTTTPCSYYEMALVKRVLSTSERQAMDAYLNGQWAVY